MDKEFRKKLDDYIRVRLTEKRYRHTEGVIYTAVRLAERYGADPEKAEIAALFHDACKNLDIEEMNTLVEEYQLGDYYIDKPQLAHSKLAAAILKAKFGVEDEDILNAVSYHTTGRADMSLLEKIIFVSDATEPNRTYDDAERLNALAFPIWIRPAVKCWSGRCRSWEIPDAIWIRIRSKRWNGSGNS